MHLIAILVLSLESYKICHFFLESEILYKMPCNCKVEDPGVFSQHQNGCELNVLRHSTGQNGHHHPHRKTFDEEEEIKENYLDESVDRETVRL